MPYKKGDSLRDAKRINQHIDATNRLLTGLNPPVEIKNSGQRKVMEARLLYITSVNPEGEDANVGVEGWIWCSAGDSSYRVAVPPIFRYPLWNGQVIDGISYVADPSNWQRRTATRLSDGETEIQVITPFYSELLGGLDTLIAISGINGDTGLKYKLVPPIQDPEDPDKVLKESNVDWQDLNLNGRVWAEEFA